MTNPTQSPDNQNPPTPAPASSWGTPNTAWGQSPGPWHQDSAADAPASAAPELPPDQPATPALAQSSPQPSISLRQFTPKRNRLAPWLLVLVGALVFAGILWFGTRPLADLTPATSPTPTVSRDKPNLPANGEFASSIAFQSERLSGVFTINDHHWDGSKLVLNLTIQVDTGSLNYSFLAMDIQTGNITEMDEPSGPDALRGGTVKAGEQVTGTISVTKNRSDTQIVLSDRDSRNITMLAVKG